MKCKIIESPDQEAKRELAKKEVDRIIRETPMQISMEMYARAVAFEAYARGWNNKAVEVQQANTAERERIRAGIKALIKELYERDDISSYATYSYALDAAIAVVDTINTSA